MTDKPRWNPAEQPYRLTEVCQSAAYGCHGWTSRVRTMATEAEGRAALAAPMKAGVLKHRLDVARLSAEGKLIGWTEIGFRTRKRRT